MSTSYSFKVKRGWYYNAVLELRETSFVAVLAFVSPHCLETSTQLQHHMNGGPRSNVVGFQCLVIGTVCGLFVLCCLLCIDLQESSEYKD